MVDQGRSSPGSRSLPYLVCDGARRLPQPVTIGCLPLAAEQLDHDVFVQPGLADRGERTGRPPRRSRQRRAKAMAIIVASPDLIWVSCRTPHQMTLVNALCWAWEERR
jgi:hypothetical protein